MGEYIRYATWELEQKEYARYVPPLLFQTIIVEFWLT
jgi:hypothetical protein